MRRIGPLVLAISIAGCKGGADPESDTEATKVRWPGAPSNLDCSALLPLKDKKILLGVLDLADPDIETPEVVAARIRRALPYVPAENIILAPDCGMKYLPRETALGKLKAMVAGAAIMRAELSRAA